jgi:hypothetical protein
LTNSDGYGGNLYSQEELIAELTACFLCNETGILPNTIENSSTFLNSWMNALNNNRKMIFIASNLAQKAVDYITGRGITPPSLFLDIGDTELTFSTIYIEIIPSVLIKEIKPNLLSCFTSQ